MAIISFILILLFCSPAYSVTLPLETNEEQFLKDWQVEWNTQIEFNKAKQRVAMRCLAYYRPNEAAWEAHLAQTFGDKGIPQVLWHVWKQHEAPFLDDELNLEDDRIIYYVRKTMIAEIKRLGGYYNIRNWYNYQKMTEHIYILEILNPLWETYENLSGREPKTSIKFDIQKMSIAIRDLSRSIALGRNAGSDDGSSDNVLDIDNNFT